MKLWLAILLAWATLSGGTAAAGPWRDGGRNLRAAQAQPDRYDRGSPRQRDAGRPERSERGERQQQQRQLSDAERRELHRDLDKARREIYKPRRDR